MQIYRNQISCRVCIVQSTLGAPRNKTRYNKKNKKVNSRMAAVTRGAPGLLQITITQSQFHHVYTFT